MSKLQKLLDSMVEEFDTYKKYQEELDGDAIEDMKSYYYYMGKAAGMRQAIRMVDCRIKSDMARSRYSDRGYID